MSQGRWPWFTIVLFLLVAHSALAADSTAVLAVEGMT